MNHIRLLIVTLAFSLMSAGNIAFAQWNTVLTDVIPTGIYISPDYSSDRTIFVIDNHRVLWRSINEGFSWSKVLTAQNQSAPEFLRMLISPEFLADGAAYVIKTNGEVLKSSDSGFSWAPMPDLPANVTDLAYSPLPGNSNYIYALTGGGGPENLFVSTDEGITWSHLQNLSSATETFPRLWISGETDSGFFLALQSEKDIYLSPDGGTNLYLSFNQGFESSLSDVVFSPEFSTDSTLYASDWKFVWKNNHAGNPLSWIKSELQTGEMPIKLAISPSFQTDRTIYATSSEKVIKRSPDGGITWENFGIPLNMNTSQIAISSEAPLTMFIGIISDDMTSGKILKSEFFNGIEDKQWLKHVNCYPNPAFGETKISFTTNKHSNITLSIFDVLGNMILCRNLGEFDTGNQSVTLPLDGNLAVSGLYFCRLHSGNEYYSIKLAVR